MGLGVFESELKQEAMMKVVASKIQKEFDLAAEKEAQQQQQVSADQTMTIAPPQPKL